MKKKGFTLIELLAVIVILAIIALITTPVVLGLIERARKGASENSAYGYIDAVEKYIMTMDISNKDIRNGTYKDSELEVEYKGKGPSNALITVEKGIVKEAKMCISKYSFDYDGEKVTKSVNNYCSNNYKVKLVIDDNIEEKSIEKNTSTTFEINNITNKTNIVCNNGATPTIENNTLTISNIFGDTTCKINSTLEDTINNIDNTENSIIMISDETINNVLLTINSNKKLNLNLNGLIIIETTTSDKPFITNNGNLNIYDSIGTGLMKTNYRLIENVNGTLNISSGNYERINSESLAGAVLSNSGKSGIVTLDGGNFKGDKVWTIFANNGKIIINNAYIYSSNNYAIVSYRNGEIIINNGTIESEKSGISVGTTTYPTGKLTINGGKIFSKNIALNNYYGDIYINGGIFTTDGLFSTIQNKDGNIYFDSSKSKIYVGNYADDYNNKFSMAAVRNIGSGYIYLKGTEIDNCDNDEKNTKKGICLYSIYRSLISENKSTGEIIADKIHVVSVKHIAASNYTGTLKIKESLIESINNLSVDNFTVDDLVGGNIYLCNNIINSSQGSANIMNDTLTGKIYYNSGNILNNSLIIDKRNSNLIYLNDTITCK